MIKKMIKNLVKKIMNPVIQESLTPYEEQLEQMKIKLDNLTENIKNNNNEILIEKEQIKNEEVLIQNFSENIKNNNNEMSSYRELIQEFTKNMQNFSENIKNNNLFMEEQKKLIQTFAENIKNNNKEMDNHRKEMDRQKSLIQDFSVNIRNNNDGYEKVLSSYEEMLSRFSRYEKVLSKHEGILSEEKNRTENISEQSSCPVSKTKQEGKQEARPENLSGDYVKEGRKIDINSVSSGQNDSLETGNAYHSIDYMDFENHFRGSKEKIKEGQKQYIQYFEGRENVVDLGCGRGEFLELLKENQIKAVGVDMYEEFVNYCNMLDLNAVHADAIHFLKSCGKVGGIFAGQLAEHLTLEQLLELCETAYEKLEEGGYFILETPNPTCLSIYANAFYIDASHVKPVHPLSLEYYLKKSGFENVKIIYTENSRILQKIPEISGNALQNEDEFNHVMKTVSNLLFGSQDYAAVAQKIRRDGK